MLAVAISILIFLSLLFALAKLRPTKRRISFISVGGVMPLDSPPEVRRIKVLNRGSGASVQMPQLEELMTLTGFRVCGLEHCTLLSMPLFSIGNKHVKCEIFNYDRLLLYLFSIWCYLFVSQNISSLQIYFKKHILISLWICIFNSMN